MGNENIFILIVILIIVLLKVFTIEELITGGAISFIIYILFNKTTENFINTDFSQEFSKYGNIKEGDIDIMLNKNLMENVSNDKYDNQDGIDKVLEAGFSTFQPIYSDGVTASNNALDSEFSLGEPETKKYTSVYNPKAYDLNEALTRKNQQSSSLNKRAKDGYVRSTKALYEKYFKNELDYQESKDWWSAEAQDFETNFSPYY